MNPPLPLVNFPPKYASPLGKKHFEFGDAHPMISIKGDLNVQAEQSKDILGKHHAIAEDHLDKWDQSNSAEAVRVDSQFSDVSRVTEHLSESLHSVARLTR